MVLTVTPRAPPPLPTRWRQTSPARPPPTTRRPTHWRRRLRCAGTGWLGTIAKPPLLLDLGHPPERLAEFALFVAEECPVALARGLLHPLEMRLRFGDQIGDRGGTASRGRLTRRGDR